MNASPTADAVVCGAGIAGLCAAYHLAVTHGVRRVVVVDERPPFSATSDKSAECYRNWWPGPGDAMVRLTGRSLDQLEALAAETGDAFAMSRAGYAYLTADPARAAAMERTAAAISAAGAGPLRVHRGAPSDPPYAPPSAEPGFAGAPDGADLLLDRDLIRRHYPFLAADVAGFLHPRRCGWLAAQTLGMLLLERARERGAELIRGRVTGVDLDGRGRVAGVRLAGGPVERIATGAFVVAAGPWLAEVAALLGVELPVTLELHAKATFEDELGVVPRDLPLMIWTDPIRLPWSDDERRDLEADPELARFAGTLPGGAHFRPEGGRDSRRLLLIWGYDHRPRRPAWPPVFDPWFPEVVLRALTRMVPGFARYFETARGQAGALTFGHTHVDGGYYCRTRENRPLVGPLPVPGAYVLGALSGFGIQAGPAAGELLAAHVTGAALPDYAPAFLLERYENPAYLKALEAAEGDGQL